MISAMWALCLAHLCDSILIVWENRSASCLVHTVARSCCVTPSWSFGQIDRHLVHLLLRQSCAPGSSILVSVLYRVLLGGLCIPGSFLYTLCTGHCLRAIHWANRWESASRSASWLGVPLLELVAKFIGWLVRRIVGRITLLCLYSAPYVMC